MEKRIMQRFEMTKQAIVAAKIQHNWAKKRRGSIFVVFLQPEFFES
jgi:hypothetical protein